MKKLFCGLLLATLGLFHLGAQAEDIDLFAGTTADQSIPPNLLLILDNAAAFSASATQTSCRVGTQTMTLSLNGTVGGVEQCALYNVVAAMDLGNPINLGVMVYNGPNVVDYLGGACNASGDGGCLVYPLTRIDNETKRSAVLTWIRAWQTSNGGAGSRWIKANKQSTGAVMQEAWAYMYGKKGLSGTDYRDIAPNTACKNFVVFVGNAVGNNGTPGDSTGNAGPKTALENLNPDTLKNANPVATALQKTPITLASGFTPANTGQCGTVNFPSDNNHENAGYYADEWARYMAANRITTYTVGFITSDCRAEYAWLLQSMAKNGSGTYFPTTNVDELVAALNTIVSEVRSVNSVFAAVSLPVSVNSQGTYLNQVFVGMFRPDINSLPRWFGNLKQYRMGFLNGEFSLLDAGESSTSTGDLAISASGSEFIAECARSFWTPLAQDDYWTANTLQNCSKTDARSNYKDGNMVEKGGQAYMLRNVNPANRVVKTCASTVSLCTTTLTDFTTSNSAITTSTLAIPSGATITRDGLINWARGQNVALEAGRKNGTPASPGTVLASTDMRPSAHGDVVHSRPAAINFGTSDASPKVVVFYGGNDGMLRAINGNRTASFNVNGSPVVAGNEFWSFLPPEFHDNLFRRYRNDEDDRITSSNTKDYAMDGPITAYRPTPTGDAYLFVGLRRGGRSLYAFKVDKDTLDISLIWKRGCLADGNCDATAQFNDMGQTWSAPQVFRAGVTTEPLVIVGGGYDTCEDVAGGSCGGTRGNKFYVLNAISGAHLKTFTTDRAVIADVTVVPDESGNAKFIYGADLGGNVYRISGPIESGTLKYQPIGNFAATDWILTRIATVGCDSSTVTCTSPPNRKFMFAPDVVVDGLTNVLLLGSGDREKPTRLENPTSNYFFMLKDRPDLGAAYLNDASCPSSTSLCLASLAAVSRGGSASTADLAKKGWYLALNGDEQVVTGAIAVFGTVYFTTHQPQAAASSSCVPNLGIARAYAVKYLNAANARTNQADAFVRRDDAGLAPDLVVGKVTLDDNTTVPFCIGCDGPIKPSQPIPPGLITNPAKLRSYWYIQK